MSRKGEKVSFRITEEKFSALTDIAEQEGVSLSELFRDYANTLDETDCNVEVVPQDNEIDTESYDGEVYPPKTHVSTEFVRKSERLELQTKHLRESLDEITTHERYLESQLSNDEVVSLESIDREHGNID